MRPNLILALGLLACVTPAGAPALEPHKTITVEVYLPRCARLFIEGQATRSKGPMRRFVSPPLPPGKYSYTIQAIIPGRNGPIAHRMADIKPDEQMVVDTELGEFNVYLWKAETLRGN